MITYSHCIYVPKTESSQVARLAKWYGDRLEITYKVAVVLLHSGVRIPYLAYLNFHLKFAKFYS